MNLDGIQARISREQRKLRKYEIRQKHAETLANWKDINSADALLAWNTYWVARALLLWFIALSIMLPVDGMVKDYFDQKNITDCERAVADAAARGATLTQANCANGVVGTTTKDGKNPDGK